MVKSKTMMVLLVLVMLIAVGFSGCLGGDKDNSTVNNSTVNNSTNNTTTPPANNTTENETAPPENNTTNATPENTTTPPASSSGSVTVSTSGSGDYYVSAKDRRFSTSTLNNVSAGQTLRIRNIETIMAFRHTYRSTENAFEPQVILPNYELYVTFNEPGTYHIELWYEETNELRSTLTVTVK